MGHRAFLRAVKCEVVGTDHSVSEVVAGGWLAAGLGVLCRGGGALVPELPWFSMFATVRCSASGEIAGAIGSAWAAASGWGGDWVWVCSLLVAYRCAGVSCSVGAF
eukprot:2028893-Prymnesium_polylepis.1